MNTCRNCGGDIGIHRTGDNACPLNGVDQSGNRKEIYMNTVYTPEQTNEIKLLRDALKMALQRIEVLEKELNATDKVVNRIDRRLDAHINSQYNPHQI